MNQVKTAYAGTVAESEQARRELEERVKEIDCLYAALNPQLIEAASLEGLLQHTVDLIPLAFSDPESICARAKVGERSFLTSNFHETARVIEQDILVQGRAIGVVEVYCREEDSPAEGGRFTEGKRRFVKVVAARLGELVRRGLAEDAQHGQVAELRAHIDLIERQREVIRQLSVPVMEIWDKVLMVPIVGTMDSLRVAELMDGVTSEISSRRARFVIVDITGVETVDTRSISCLVELATTVRLLGASYVLSGVQPSVAMTISALGADVSNLKVCASVLDGLQECLRQMGRARVAGMLLASILRM